jgi:hypothetical protein
MTPDEIILMADASGISLYGMGKDRAKFIHYLEAFAKLVAKAEREVCAKILDANAMACHTPIMRSLLQANAQAIRVRGQA